MKKITLLFALFLSSAAFASTLIKGLEAEQRFHQLVELQEKQPEAVTSYTNQFFGDSARPELGRLWVTTVYLTHNHTYYCNKNEFREKNLVEYICEIY